MSVHSSDSIIDKLYKLDVKDLDALELKELINLREEVLDMISKIVAFAEILEDVITNKKN
jgi:hypothetical protein